MLGLQLDELAHMTFVLSHQVLPVGLLQTLLLVLYEVSPVIAIEGSIVECQLLIRLDSSASSDAELIEPAVRFG